MNLTSRWYLQPSPGRVTLAEVSPAVQRPEDLALVFGEMPVDAGLPHQVTGFEITSLNEWYLKVLPGHGVVREVRLTPWDDPEVRGVAWDDCSGASFATGRAPNQVQLGSETWTAQAVSAGSGWITSSTLSTIAYAWENAELGWEVECSLASGATLSLYVARNAASGEGYGVAFTRQSDELVVSGLVYTTAGGLVTTEWSRIAYTGSTLSLGAAHHNQSGSEVTQYVKLGDRWLLSEALTVSSFSPTQAVCRMEGSISVSDLLLFSTGWAHCVYAVPEQWHGDWATASERIASRSEFARYLSPHRFELATPATTLTQLAINNEVVSSFVATIDGREVEVDQDLHPDSRIEVTYQAVDMGLPYRGYQATAGFATADLNWVHPWSPLHRGGTVYLRAMPTFIRHYRGATRDPFGGGDSWRTTPSRVAALRHDLTPYASGASPILAAITLPSTQPPALVDRRELPVFEQGAGRWYQGGSGYLEAGGVIIEVPQGYENLVREQTQHSVPAGIMPLVQERTS